MKINFKFSDQLEYTFADVYESLNNDPINRQQR